MLRKNKLLAIYGRFAFILLVLVSAFVYAMFQGGKVSWTIFYMILPFVCYSMLLFFYPLSDLIVERTIRTPNVQKGEQLVVSVTLKRKFRFPLLYTVATEQWAERDVAALAGNRLKHLFVLGLRKEVTWDYEIDQMPRGEHVLRGIEIEISDFFGWIRKTKFIAVTDTILIYPKTVGIDYVASDTQYDRGSAASPFHIVKDTTMATGVRDYQAGDRVAWIHWKSFARTQTLMTKEFEDRCSQEILVLLDGRQSTMFEEQVELAASILKEAAKQHVGLAFMTAGAGGAVFPFIQSEEQLHRALVHLAKVQPTQEETVQLSPSRGDLLQHGGRVVVITGRLDESFVQTMLRNVGNAQSILCLLVAKRDDPKLLEMEAMIQSARSRGITVRVLEQEQFAQAFNGVAKGVAR